MSTDSFGSKSTFKAGGRELEIYRLDALQPKFDVARLPFSLKILLENLLRREGDGAVDASDIEALATWDAAAEPSREIAFTPARVVLQDFTGVPCVVDLAAMRDAAARLMGRDRLGLRQHQSGFFAAALLVQQIGAPDRQPTAPMITSLTSRNRTATSSPVAVR